MKILGLDSSGIVASVAVVEDEILTAEYTVNYKKTHSQTLLPMLDEVAKMTELDLDTVDAIAVAGGPGSFTGLRIGSATAKGLGLALKKPLISVPTVEALAYNLYDTQGLICPIMDARRNQVYTGIYRFKDHRLQTVEDQMAVPIEELLAKLEQYGERVTFLGEWCACIQKTDPGKASGSFQLCSGSCKQTEGGSSGFTGACILRRRTIRNRRGACAGLPSCFSGGKRAGRTGKSERSGGCTMTFREMLVEDLEQVVDIEQKLFSVPWTKEGFLTYLMKKDTMFFVVEEKERILGYCSMMTVLDEGDILNVAVRSDRQKEGIGQFLVDSMLRMAEMQGIKLVHLEVRQGNGTARRLYQRLGFKEDGLRRNYYENPVENAVLMTKEM